MNDGEITRELEALRRGEGQAMERLFALVYERLGAMARGRLGPGGRNASLDTHALVHEAYLKFVHHGSVDLRDRDHFFGVAGRAMRQIVIDHVRRGRADKRWGALARTKLTGVADDRPDRTIELLELDEALTRLAAMNERLCRIVELKFFVGLSFEEIASTLGVTERTVYRDWRKARAFLATELDR